MTVGELIEALGDFGDHVPVLLVINRGEDDVHYPDFEVADHNLNGEVHVCLEADA